MYTLQSTICSISVVNGISADFSAVFGTSNVISTPSLSCLIRSSFMSNPTVEYFLLNSMARGNPTYPNPIIAIDGFLCTILYTPFL